MSIWEAVAVAVESASDSEGAGASSTTGAGSLEASWATSSLSCPFQLSYSGIRGTDPQQCGLDIFNVLSVVSGDYKCQLGSDSSCGTVIDDSTIAEVRVQYEPSDPPVCLPPSSEKVVLGESVTLSCSSDPGKPVVVLRWFHGSSTTPEPEQSNAVVCQNPRFPHQHQVVDQLMRHLPVVLWYVNLADS